MVQPYVASVDARGETATLFFDGAFSHAIHKGPLLEHGVDPTTEVFLAETIEPREASAAERAVAERVLAYAVERFGPLAYARVDLVEDADGAPVLLELELTEPSLFFAGEPGRLSEFGAAIRRRLPGS
jgi:O-ureido-D-serine cyclo-ligase